MADSEAKPEVDLTEDKVFPLGWGLVFCAVCAPAHWTPEEVAADVTRNNPPGTSLNEWIVSEPRERDDDFNNTNCIECPDDPNRKHWLLNC